MGFEAGIGVWGVIVARVVFLTLVWFSFRFLVLFALKRVCLQRYLSSWSFLRLLLTLLINNSFELCKNLYLEIQITQMNYLWAMSKAVFDKTKNSSNAANKLSSRQKDQEPKRESNQRQENNSSNNDSPNPYPSLKPHIGSMPNICLMTTVSSDIL